MGGGRDGLPPRDLPPCFPKHWETGRRPLSSWAWRFWFCHVPSWRGKIHYKETLHALTKHAPAQMRHILLLFGLLRNLAARRFEPQKAYVDRVVVVHVALLEDVLPELI